jgi:hypothetical protein
VWTWAAIWLAWSLLVLFVALRIMAVMARDRRSHVRVEPGVAASTPAGG